MDETSGRGHPTSAATPDEDPRPFEYDHRGDAERTAIVEEDAAEWAEYVAEYEAELAAEAAELAEADADDPGPVPPVVEPVSTGNMTTIPVSPRAWLQVVDDVGRTGHTGLTVELASGVHVTVALPPAVVDALVTALWNSTAVPLLPATTTTDQEPNRVGGVR